MFKMFKALKKEQLLDDALLVAAKTISPAEMVKGHTTREGVFREFDNTSGHPEARAHAALEYMQVHCMRIPRSVKQQNALAKATDKFNEVLKGLDPSYRTQAELKEPTTTTTPVATAAVPEVPVAPQPVTPLDSIVNRVEEVPVRQPRQRTQKQIQRREKFFRGLREIIGWTLFVALLLTAAYVFSRMVVVPGVSFEASFIVGLALAALAFFVLWLITGHRIHWTRPKKEQEHHGHTATTPTSTQEVAS